MHSAAFLSSLLLLATAAYAAPLEARQSAACFIPGKGALPAEVQDVVNSLAGQIECGTTKTVGNVLDVSSNGVSFSSIDFSKSNKTPLGFALDTFTSTDEAELQDQLNVYLATEAGIRSEGGSLAIKVPKFFLQMKIATVKQKAGENLIGAGTVDHQLQKVLKNAAREDKALLDQVKAIAAAK